MATVTVFSAARMQEIEDNTVVAGFVDVDGHLLLEKHDGSTVDAGKVQPENLEDADHTISGIARLATSSETVTGTDDTTIVTPKDLSDAMADTTTFRASTIKQGPVELATPTEAVTGTDAVRAVTPLGLSAALAAATETYTGIVSSTWTIGQAPVVLDAGQGLTGTVTCYIGRNVDVMPGDKVVIERVGANFFITSAALLSPLKPIMIPLMGGLISSSVWVDYKDLPGVSSMQGINGFEYGRARISKTSSSWVSMSGLISNSVATLANHLLMTLPTAFSPLQRKRLILFTTAGQIGCIVETNGQVILESALAVATAVSLNGLKWTNDPAITWTNLTMVSPYTAFGGTDGTPRLGLDSLGRAFSEGLVKGGTVVNTVINTAAYPSGFRWTASAQLFMAYELSNTSSRLGRIDNVTPVATTNAGKMTFASPASNTGRSLDLDWLPDALASLYVSPVLSVPNYNPGASGWNSFGAAKLSDGSVHLKGLLAPTATGIIGYLPPGYRPADTEIWAVLSTDLPGRIDIYADGRIIWNAGTVGFVSLENISFIAEK